ncbi:hypothetical protein [Pseudomonas putida]|uniref:Uncharacterized protein n=1 Tax=Pseudomonas putida ND6 TaxID=231023 RepID=I3V1N4_PSEPU|nr:hypothetical protein [Pseudomonas putida]AFK71655.1 hypothetical protein YSA_09039 [Pseudomonas putida ND6]ANC80472.1 hypothetical protein KKK_05450 [Pseudomonas putida B6-2]
MANKFLYGRLEHLGIFLDGGLAVPEDRGIRFCDIIHYKTMENETVRDDESRRVFNLDKEWFTIEINGKVIDSKSMSDNPGVTLAVPRCYCLCLSHKKDDADMFERFRADVCIEVDTDFLVRFLTEVLSKRFPFRVLHGDIFYYPKVMTSAPPVEEALIFYKDEELYSIEAEYRIALVLPEKVYLLAGEEKIEVLKGDEPSYMQIGHKERSFWSDVFKRYTKLSDLVKAPPAQG